MKVVLTIVAGPHEGQQFQFDRHDSFIVGRGRDAHFRLPRKDQYFSRAHFLVEVNPPLCRLVDLKSTNGTLVNGEQVEQKDLEDGDQIQGGDTVIQVQIDDEGETLVQVTAPDRTPAVEQTAVPSLQDGFPVIPDYIIQDKLGEGGMGQVFLAMREVDAQLVAVKTIRSGAMQGNETRRFVREAEMLEKISHPNIVSFWESGSVGELMYFVMEFVAGEDARALLKQHPQGIPVVNAVRIGIKVLDALEYAHGLGLVHRDIKPANILLHRQEGRVHVKLADFGLARMYQETSASGLTMTGEFGGTLPYMPPEQITDFRNAAPTVDQFSTAASVYRLLTGHLIYELPEDTSGRIVTVLEGKPFPIQKRRSDLPGGLGIVIHKALSKNPADRYPSVAEFRDALKPFARLKKRSH